MLERNLERLQREDRRSGEVAAALYNTNNDWKKNPKGWNWMDFYPEHKEQRVQSDDAMLAAMDMWTKVKPLPS